MADTQTDATPRELVRRRRVRPLDAELDLADQSRREFDAPRFHSAQRPGVPTTLTVRKDVPSLLGRLFELIRQIGRWSYRRVRR